ETSTELRATTCRSCRARLGLDGEADESRRLEALFVLSLMLGLRPGELRSLVLPRRAVEALRQHKKRQAAERLKAGGLYHDTGLVFCYEDGRMFSRWA